MSAGEWVELASGRLVGSFGATGTGRLCLAHNGSLELCNSIYYWTQELAAEAGVLARAAVVVEKA